MVVTNVVYSYMENSGLDRPSCSHPTEETWIDLLTDLRHMAAGTLIDFDKVVRASEHHYSEETR
jgi:hypothetical protein